MRKRMKAAWKSLKKNNVGFTMIELIVAIAILGVISATVTYIMISSSKSYRSMSVETQLQSEAQLVANSISELAVDCYDASSKLDGLSIGEAYSNTDGQVLLLDSKVDEDKKQYIIAFNSSDKELWLAERDFDETDNTWEEPTEFSLLGENIEDFTVDDSRVKEDNVLLFQFAYKRDGRVYKGNYQILMRNRAYADQEQVTKEDDKVSLVLGLKPKVIYLDMYGMGTDKPVVSYYRINNVLSTPQLMPAEGIKFESTVISNRTLGNDANKVEWEILNAGFVDSGLNAAVSLLETGQAATNYLKVTDANLLKSYPSDSFSIGIKKSITVKNDSGEQEVAAQPKTALIMLRQVKNITIRPISGYTQWNNVYDEIGKSNTEDNVLYYAYADADGNYGKMTVNAEISQSNIAFGGGVKWTLEKKEQNGSWSACEDYAKLETTESDTNTSTTITFSEHADEGQVYRVVATSKFDETVTAEFKFGMAPTGEGNDSGFNSRGFYVDITSYIKTLSNYENVSISNMRLEEKDSDIVLKKIDGRWYLYVSYDVRSGAEFYSGTRKIPIHITRTGNAQEDTETINYEVKPVHVAKSDQDAPQNTDAVLVLRKGRDQNVTVWTQYYNVIGQSYFGVYLDDMESNINTGTDEIKNYNKYISVEVKKPYGTAHDYIDKVTTRLTAKASFSDYNPNPMQLRLTADDYYVTSNRADTSSYTDYTVFIANVKDMDVFILTPDTKEGVHQWTDQNFNSGNKFDVGGYNAQGNWVEKMAKVYKQGNQYKCDYMGSTYTYNKTYHYWNK